MTFERFQHPPPVYWEEFEDICLSLFSAVWGYPMAQKNGRSGNPQQGVDVWGRLADDRWVAVQCKRKDALCSSTVTKDELREEVRKALTFEPGLTSWTLVTTGKKSAKIEAEARRISDEHQSKGLFEVHVLGWEDLRSLIGNYPEVIEQHFRDVAPSHRQTARQVEEIHAAIFDPARAGGRAAVTELLGRPDGAAPDQQALDGDAEARLRVTLGAASSLLLNWPATTGGRWFSRPEVATLADHVLAQRPEPMVILGPPGAGKSAVLARLGKDLAVRGVAMLALKADTIPRYVTSAAMLDDFLGTPEPLDTCLIRLASDQLVVLLIDQLDALADLMDQHGGRLNVLLRLVAQLRGCPRLSVVLSCREFEFRHDARLTTLTAGSLRLQPVAWAEVEDLLRSRGLSPEGWHPEFKEVLLVPQHLDIFLRYLADADAPVPFDSYHGMLEEVFHTRVLAGPEGGENAAALYDVARGMGEEEDLWIPVARFDPRAAALDRMEAAGFLRREGTRVGFRHQTLFDFVRSRAFVAGGESVASYALARQGTMFARPTVWSALSYLRAADRSAYEREVQRLWLAAGVRPHLRHLLRDLMGRQPDPGDEEARRLLPLLADPASAARALRAMVGSKGWFRRLVPRLPALMADTGEVGWAAAILLRFMVNEDTPTVLALLERCWTDTARHRLVGHVLDDLRAWTPASLRLAMAIVPSLDSFAVVHLAGKMTRLPSLDVAAFVLARLEAVTAEAETTSPVPGGVRRFFSGETGLHGLPDIMRADPGPFVRVLWPWVARVAERLASPPHRPEAYRPDGGGMLARFGEHDAGAESRFGIVFARTVAAWGATEPAAFLKFAAAAAATDLAVLHAMLAAGYVAAAPFRPSAPLDYLVEDPRRFRLGDYTDGDRITRDLIAAAAIHLDSLGAERLADAVFGLRLPREPGRYEPTMRRNLCRWHREAKLRLLLAIPEGVRSGNLGRFIQEEVRAVGIPGLERAIWSVNGPDVQMSGEAMRKAGDEDVLRFLGLHLDNSEWGSVLQPRRGRSIDASRAFGDFAKSDPERALRMIDRLPAGELERPAADALSAFSDGSLLPPGTLAALVVSLHRRGFASPSFRHAAAYALAKAARPLKGLDDEACAMLRDWLVDWEAPAEERQERSVRRDEHARPIIWDDLGMRFLPGGNYPVLRALTLGMLFREPSAADAWLEHLEQHSARAEDPAVWLALADDLRFLVHADRPRASAFLAGLLERRPLLADSREGARLLAWTHGWLPDDVVRGAVQRWMLSNWEGARQAAGELVALRWLMRTEDGWAASLIAFALGPPQPDDFGGFRLGLAYTAEATWDDPRYREAATSIFERLSRWADNGVATAVSRVFQRAQGKAWDAATERILRLATGWPALLAADAHFLPDLLKEVLRDGMDPDLVADVALGIVGSAGRQLGDVRTTWAGSAGDLFEIATTLQRTTAEAKGIGLFEALLEADVHTVDESMARFDRNRLT